MSLTASLNDIGFPYFDPSRTYVTAGRFDMLFRIAMAGVGFEKTYVDIKEFPGDLSLVVFKFG
jgi:hypothetical protein